MKLKDEKYNFRLTWVHKWRKSLPSDFAHHAPPRDEFHSTIEAHVVCIIIVGFRSHYLVIGTVCRGNAAWLNDAVYNWYFYPWNIKHNHVADIVRLEWWICNKKEIASFEARVQTVPTMWYVVNQESLIHVLSYIPHHRHTWQMGVAQHSKDRVNDKSKYDSTKKQ